MALTLTGTLSHTLACPIRAGMFAELHRVLSAADVSAYASLLGDTNPLHLDAAYAARTRFKRPIAHGLLYAGLIPSIFGGTIPASVYVSQALRFSQPVFVGDAVIARIEVKAARRAPARAGAPPQLFVTCDTAVRLAESGRVAVSGEAVVMLPVLE
jgi:acyl dehydratase